MTENQRHRSNRILPKSVDVIMLPALMLALIATRVFLYEEVGFAIYIPLGYCLICMVTGWGQRASMDSCELKYYILGVIPVNVYWKDVSQIGIIHVYRGSGHRLLGEMFVIVLKPCKKYKEGFGEFRWWNIRPKLRHPFLVKNIYCDTGKYKEIIEEYSRKKVSFEIEYS